MLKRSSNLESFIMDQEKFSVDSYEDFGRTSIGYGTSGTPGQKTSEPQARLAMQAHLDAMESELSNIITRRDLPQHRQDVLLDLAYNLGTPRMRETGIIDLVNQGKDDEVAALIGRINKARDQKTGKMVTLEGLVKRANLRQSMWNGQATGETPEADDGFLADFDRVINSASESISSSLADDEFLSDFDKVTSGPSDRGSSFALATDISLPDEADRDSKTSKIANEFGVSKGLVDSLLSQYDEATVRLKLDEKNIKSIAPKTAEFASTPANNALVKKDPEIFKRVEFLTKYMGGDKSPITKGLNTSFLRAEDGLVMMQVLNGQISKEEAIKKMRSVEEGLSQNALDNDTKKALMKAGDVWGKAWDTLTETEQKKNISEILSAGGDVAKASGSYFLEMFKDPKGWLAFQLENGGMGLIAGVTTGFVGRGAVEALTSYGGLVREKLEEYRDPITGQVNYEAFLSDKEMLNTLNKEAATYAGTIGLVSGAYQKAGGKLIAKGGMSGAAASVALAATSEGFGETSARSAGQVASGQEVTLKENIQEGFIETLAGTPTAVASAGAQAIINRAGGVKTGAKLSEANKANDATLGTSEIKAELNSNPLTDQFPSQIKEHLDTVTEVDAEALTERLTDENPTITTVEKAVLNARAQADAGSVSFSPSEWDAFNADRGVDPTEALAVFSPEIRQLYADSKASDTSLYIPYSEWVLATKQDPEIDVIARFTGNAYNTLEANEVIDAFQKNPMVFFDTTENTTSMEEVVEQKLPEWNFTEEGPDGMVRLDLSGPFATIEEGEAYNSFRNRIARVMPQADKAFADDLALVELRRLRMRSEISGVSLAEALNRIQFSRGDKSQVTTPTFDKNFFSVVLGEKANPISAIHELAHVWLHEMAEDYLLIKDVDTETMTPDIREYRKAMDSAVELLGLDSLDDILLGDITRVNTAQEVFAQTAEKYFMDSQADNSRVKALMDRMRLWMLKYYDALRSLAQRKFPTLKMTPKVKSMFDSILAANNVAQDQVNALFPDPLFTRSDLGDTKTSEAYFADFQLARSQAIAEVAGKSIIRDERENQRIFDQEYSRLWKEVEADVDATPAMIYRSQMEDSYKEFKVNGGQDPRLSFESVRDTFFNGNEAATSDFKKAIPFYIMTGKKKGGVSVETYMMLMNISNPNDFLALLSDTGKREDMIIQGVDSRISEIEPKLKSKEQIRQAAEEAVSKEGRFRLIKREVQIMKDRMGTSFQNLTVDLINAATNLLSDEGSTLLKEEARVAVGSAKSARFNALTYFRDMNRFSREASKKFKANDLEQAMSAKVKEAQKDYQFREALKAEKKKEIAISRIKRLYNIYNSPSDLINNYDKVGIELAIQAVNQVNAGRMPGPFSKEEISKMVTGLSADQVDAMNKALSVFADYGKTGSDVTIDGIIALGQFSKTAIKMSSMAKQIYLDGKKKAIKEVVDEVLPKVKEGNVVGYQKKGEQDSTWMSRTRVANEKARAALSGLFPSEKQFLESALGSLYATVAKRSDERVVAVSALKKRVREQYNKIPLKFKDKLPGKKASNIFSWKVTEDKTFTFNSLDEVEAAMLYMGSESGARAMTVGNLEIGEMFIPQVNASFWDFVDSEISKGNIPSQYLDVVQEKWNIARELYPQMKEELAKTAGIEVGEIKGWKVKVGSRELEGGYMTKLKKKDRTSEGLMEALDGSTQFLSITTLPNKDMGITKVRNHESPLDFNVGAFEAYLEAATQIIYLRDPLSAMAKVITEPSMKEALDLRRPGMLDNVLVPWIKRTSLNSRVDQQGTDYSGTESQLSYLRRNSGMVFFLGNLKTVLSQALGLLPSANEVGSVTILKEALSFGFNPRGSITRARELSPALRARAISDTNVNIRGEEQIREDRGYLSQMYKLSEKGTYIPIHIAQNAIDTITWNAAYAKGMKTLSPAKAIEYADSVVKKTQGSSNIDELANIQTSSELMRLFTAFSTVPLLNYEIMSESFRRGQGTIPAQWIGTLQATMFVALLPAMIETMLIDEAMQMLKLKEEDEDEEDKALIALMRGVGTASSSVFIAPLSAGVSAMALKGAAMAGDKAFGTEVASSTYSGRATPPAIKKLEDGYKAADAAYKAMFNNVPMTAKEQAKFYDLLTLLTGRGIPFTLMGRYNLYKENSLTDNEKAILDRQRRVANKRANN